VPSLYNALLNHPRVKVGKVDFRSMRVCVSGAAPLMAETARRFQQATGARIVEGYALTESVLAATVCPVNGPEKPGSVGVPLPDCAVVIVDADDPSRELGFDEVGEILLTGPQIMKSYWGNEEEDGAMIEVRADGRRWLHTADLGYMDTDGFVYIVDRKKDLIKMSGMQVWPREIEEVIAQHPAVVECGVRGFPDDRRGEVAVAFVVRRVGQAVTEEDIRSWVKARIAPFKTPARVVFRKDLPKSMLGKVLRRFLTEDTRASA
jgi:long-chain acyl-CoA synthetase